MTLTEFLLARLAEDEKWARQRGRWRIDTTGCCVVDSEDGDTIAEMVWDNAAHIARWSPAHVLAECGAKRAIVQRCTDLIASFGDWDAPEALAAGGRVLWTDVNRRERAHAHDTLHALANVYADHPAFDPAWRDTPET